MTDYKRTVVFNYLATFANIATGLILIPIIAEKLGYEKLGVFSLLFSIKAIADIGVGWMGGAFVKQYIANNISANSVDETSDIFFFSNVLYAVYSALFVCLFGVYAFVLNGEIETITVLGFALYIYACFMMRPVFEIFTATSGQHKVAKYRFAQQILFLLTSLPSIMFFQSISLLFVLAGITSFTIVVFLNVSNRKYFSQLSFPNMSLIKKIMVTDGKNYALFGVGLICMLQVDVIVLDLLHGSVAVALFAIAWRVPNTIVQLAWRLSEPMAAIVAKQLREKSPGLKTIQKQNQIRMIGVAILASIGYYFLIEKFLSWWMPSFNFEELAYFKVITAFSICALIIIKFYSDLFYYQQQIVLSGFSFVVVVLVKILGIVFLYSTFNVLSSLLTMSLFLLIVSIPFHVVVFSSIIRSVPSFVGEVDSGKLINE